MSDQANPDVSGQRVVHLTHNVFVAGSEPSVTYNPRSDRNLEAEVHSYLAQPGKALSVSGPTKSGKTVLIAKLVPDYKAIWMHGSDLTSADAFWSRINDSLDLDDAREVTEQVARQVTSTRSGSVGIPRLASANAASSDSDTTTEAIKSGRKRSPVDVARDGLKKHPVPIVVDDFHYVPDDVKRDIARAIKSILPITHVIMIAVPHEAFEAVRREPDMTGRVWNLQIDHWSVDELMFIARTGFEALNVADADNQIARHLATTSYGAPFLMQQLCYDVSIANGIQETGPETFGLAPQPDWEAFFRRIAKRSVPDVFEKLVRGPKQRGRKRIKRNLKNGVQADLYGAIIQAIAIAGPETTMSQQQIFKELKANLNDPLPRSNEVTSALTHMSTIAENSRGTGDPALAFKDGQLHILDPFLAFYLRWGA